MRAPRILASSLLIGALTACQTPFGFGGDEWDADPDGAELTDTSLGPDSPSGAGAPVVLASRAFCAEGLATGLAADVDGADVWLTHVGFADECASCAQWSVTATPAGTTLSLGYDDLDAATCDCDCAVQGIDVVLTGFSAEPWTIEAGDDTLTLDLSE